MHGQTLALSRDMPIATGVADHRFHQLGYNSSGAADLSPDACKPDRRSLNGGGVDNRHRLVRRPKRRSAQTEAALNLWLKLWTEVQVS